MLLDREDDFALFRITKIFMIPVSSNKLRLLGPITKNAVLCLI